MEGEGKIIDSAFDTTRDAHANLTKPVKVFFLYHLIRFDLSQIKRVL